MDSTFSLMTYNVENLFDTVHDQGKLDWTYMPLAVKRASPKIQKYCRRIGISHYRRECLELDWSKKTLNKKIANLSRVLKSYNKGRTADIIVFQEVENRNVLQMLRDRGLSNQGLDHLAFIEGNDRRGIDVAILSRFPLVKPAHLNKVVVDTKKTRRSVRGILEATFDVWGREVTILANHWPSQGSPDSYRNQAAEAMRKIAAKNPHRVIIAAGDFNILSSDHPNGFLNWIVNDDFTDTFHDPLGFITHSLPKEGTYWYRGNWSYLDRIFVWSPSYEELHSLFGTFRMLAHKWMLRDLDSKKGRGIPRRFESKKGRGFSDHLPLTMKFQLK